MCEIRTHENGSSAMHWWFQKELENTKAQLVKVEEEWQDEYKFYAQRQQKLEADIELANKKVKTLQ